MFLSFVALISSLAIASSLTIVKDLPALQKNDISKQLEERLRSKIVEVVEEKKNLRLDSDKKVEVVNFVDGYVQTTYTSVYAPAQVVAQQTFIGGIYGPLTGTGLTGTVYMRLQFDTVTSTTYQLSFYSTNPSSGSPTASVVLTGPTSDLVTDSSNGVTTPPSVSLYTYTPKSNTTVQAALGGSAVVFTKYSATAPLYLTGLPQVVQTVTIFGATIFTAQFFTGVYNSGKVSYQLTAGALPQTPYPSAAGTKYPTFAPVTNPPQISPTVGYTVGATYYLAQFTQANGGGIATAVYVSGYGYYTVTLGGPFTYTSATSPATAVTLVTTYTAVLNAPSSSSSSSTTCFSGSSEVAMESGAIKQISEVAVGDRVLAYSTKTQSAVFSSVVAVPHNKNNKVSEFVQITTESGKVVKMTSEHLIQSCEGLVAASKIASGACVVTVDGQENVSAVEKVVEEGLYTIVTEEELVVVDGVVASPFAVNHFIPNMFYNFHRFAFGLMPSFLSTKMMESVSTVADEVAQYYTVATDSL